MENRTIQGEQYKDFVGGEATVLMEGEASKKALVELAGTARYLHIATHGGAA